MVSPEQAYQESGTSQSSDRFQSFSVRSGISQSSRFQVREIEKTHTKDGKVNNQATRKEETI